MIQPLNNNDREALIIRWRTILRLALIDYFDVSYDYSKIIVKEILDIEQAIVKSSCSANVITVPERGFPERLIDEICEKIPVRSRRRVKALHEELNGLRNTFRNPETHTLSLPMPPPETVTRCCKRLRDLVDLLDLHFETYAKNEAKGFARVKYFYYEIVMRERVSYYEDLQSKLLVQLKLRTDEVEIRTERGSKQRGSLINEERSPFSTVKLIESGELDTEEFHDFVRAALSTTN